MDHNCKYPRNPAAEFLRAALFLALASAVSFTSNSERSISYNKVKKKKKIQMGFGFPQATFPDYDKIP